MNKEIAITNKQEFQDGGSLIEGFDSDPEHIKNFPKHLQSCSKTSPLEIRIEIIAGEGMALEKKKVSCTECKGTDSKSIKI